MLAVQTLDGSGTLEADGEIMEELDNLVRLSAVALDESGATAFAKAADHPGTDRYRVTDRGKRIAESPKGEDLAIEEIV